MPIFVFLILALYLVIAWCLIASAVRYAIGPLISVPGPSGKARLEELDRIRDQKLISPEEYNAKRQEILKDL
jgi:hypothetical protein